MEHASVSEIHRYPLRPEGFEEPLFPAGASKREVAEHLLRSSWLMRASELSRGTGGAARALRERVEVRRGRCGIEVMRPSGRGSLRRLRVVEVIDRWREVRGWWDEEDGVDRIVVRVLLSGGALVDLSRGRSGEWLLVGVVD